MCERKIVKKTKRFRDSRRLTESEAFIYLVGIGIRLEETKRKG